MKFDKKRFIPALLLVALAMVMVLPECTHAASAPSIIIVPVDYPTISAAISNAVAGDTIIVQSGTYYENPVINKPLTIEGENSANTVVVGTGDPTAVGTTVYTVGASVFTITSDNVKISGFTITSFNYSAQPMYPNGVLIEANNCVVTDNNIVNTFSGVFISGQFSIAVNNNNITGSRENGVITYGGFNNTISSNNIVSSVAKDGITTEGYSYNITGNNISQSSYGLGMGSTYSVVFKNNITDDNVAAIWLVGSDNIIAANYLSNSRYGIYLVPSFGLASSNTIYHNDLIDNTQNAASNTVYNIQTWDDGSQGGNYWSDYSTVYPNAAERGNSGIMNTPYTICANNTDNDPLMKPFDISNAGACPREEVPPQRSSDVAGSWSFQSVEPDGVTPDATGNNPAVFGSDVSNVSYVPEVVSGKIGNALYFNGVAYAYVPPSPSVLTPNDLTIEAWVYLDQYKNDTYNNIVIEAVSTPTSFYENRTIGFAINGYVANGSSTPELGALRGYVTTDTGGFNEIDTTTPLSLNTWYYVVFTRSTQTGMHIYVNGVEQNVTVFAGVQNPAGLIVPPTAIYLGHDSISTQEDAQILSVASLPTSTSIWQQWWFWTPIATVFLILVGAFYYVRKNGIRRKNAISKSPPA